jgi:hypothetical protein
MSGTGMMELDNSVEEPLLGNASINSKKITRSNGTKQSSNGPEHKNEQWGRLRTSVKFSKAIKTEAETTKEMEEGIKAQHLSLTSEDIDKATLYILDSFEGMGMTHGVSHEDLLIHKMLYDSWFEVWYIVAICFYIFEGLFSHALLDEYMIYAIVFEIIFISTFTYDIYLHWYIETDDDEEETQKKAWKYYEEQKLLEEEEIKAKISHLHAAFHRFDQDGNGCINRRELLLTLRDLGIKLSPQTFRKIYSALDQDRDGEINFPEFESLINTIFGVDDMRNKQSKRAFEIANNKNFRKCCNVKLPDSWTIYRGFLVIIQYLDLFLFIATRGLSIRFSRFTRPLILVLRVQTLRVVLVGVLVAGVKIARVLFLIACDIIFFGFVGFVLFSKVEDSKGFVTPFDGMRTMLLVLTAPGTVLADMEPLQRHSSGWASIFFIIFVVITSMIFQKLILANAYRSYKAYQKQQYFKRLENSKNAGKEAFNILAKGRPAINKETWRLVFADLRDAEHPMVADTIFHTCDMEYSLVPGNDYLEIDAFLELITLAKHTGTALKHLELHEKHELTRFKQLQMDMRGWFKIKANLFFFKFEIIHTIVDLLVLLSIAQLYVSITYPQDVSWKYIGFIILVCFTVEVGAKMIAFGMKKYFSYGEHVLDAFCVGAGIIFFTYESVTNSQGGTLYNIALALRTLRVLKFLWLSETLHGLLWTIIKLGDSLVKLFFILFVPLYMFATVAQQIFGTTVVTSVASEAIKKTKWYAVRSELNFETGMNSMRTLFEITTVSSWNMVMEAADILYGNKQYTFWVELFFFSFRIIMTMMFVPILTGFLIESFVTSFDTYEKHHQQKKGETEDVTKSHEMEIRLLNTDPNKVKEIIDSKISKVSHAKHTVVKTILKDRHTMADTEKKIYGVDSQIKDELIHGLRESKLRLEEQLMHKEMAVMRQQKAIINANRESRRLTYINATLRDEMKKRQTRARGTSLPPPPPPSLFNTSETKLVEDAIDTILKTRVVPKEPPMPPLVLSANQSEQLSSSPVQKTLL